MTHKSCIWADMQIKLRLPTVVLLLDRAEFSRGACHPAAACVPDLMTLCHASRCSTVLQTQVKSSPRCCC